MQISNVIVWWRYGRFLCFFFVEQKYVKRGSGSGWFSEGQGCTQFSPSVYPFVSSSWHHGQVGDSCGPIPPSRQNTSSKRLDFGGNPEETIWLVVYLPLLKMMEFVSWDDDIPFPTVFWKVIIQSCSSHHQPAMVWHLQCQPRINKPWFIN